MRDADWYYRKNLYYFLVRESDGAVVTPPMIFRSTGTPTSSLRSSEDGYGNTMYLK